MGGLLLAAPALGGCYAGQLAETNLQGSTIDGVNEAAGGVEIRYAHVPPGEGEGGGYPEGADVPVRFYLVNATPEPAELRSVIAPAAGSTTLVLDGEEVDVVPVPPNGEPQLVGRDLELGVDLQDYSRELGIGALVPVTLVFDVGTVELSVPVQVEDGYLEDQEEPGEESEG